MARYTQPATATSDSKFILNPKYEAALVDSDGLFLGCNDLGGKNYASPATLKDSSIWVIGPPGKGKTTLMDLWFQILCHTKNYLPIVIDCKQGGGLAERCRNYIYNAGLVDRLVDFDVNKRLYGLEPARRPGVSPWNCAEELRDKTINQFAIKSLDETRQLSQYAFLGGFAAALAGQGLFFAYQILQPRSPVRRLFLHKLAEVNHPMLEGIAMGLAQIESFSQYQREKLISPTLAIWAQWLMHPYLNDMLRREPVLNIEEVIRNNQLLVIDPGHGTALRSIDTVRNFVRFVLTDIKNIVFSMKDLKKRVVVLVDEAHLAITPELARNLILGRESKLTYILANQTVGQWLDEDPSEHIFDAVLSACQIRCVFGGLSRRDLERIVPEVFLQHLNPYKIKHLRKTLETRHKEIWYNLESYGESFQEGVSESRGGSSTDGTSYDLSEGDNWAVALGKSYGKSRGRSRSHTDGTALMRGSADGVSLTRGSADGVGFTRGSADGITAMEGWSQAEVESSHWLNSAGLGDMASYGDGANMVELPDGTMIPSISTHTGGGNNSFASTGEGGGHAVANGVNGALAQSHVDSTALSANHVDSTALSRSHIQQSAVTTSHADTVGESEEESETDSINESRGGNRNISRGMSHQDSVNWGQDRGQSHGITKTVTPTPIFVPTYSDHFEPEFMSLDEQTVEFMQQLQAMPKRFYHACVDGKVVPTECAWNEGTKVRPHWLQICEGKQREKVRLLAPGQKEVEPPPKLLIEPPKKRRRGKKEDDRPEDYEE